MTSRTFDMIPSILLDPKTPSMAMLEAPIIEIDEIPTTPSWNLPVLTRLGARNRYLLWQIGYDGTTSELVIRRGQLNRTITESRRKVTTNRSGRSLIDQALLESRRRHTDQIYKGYHRQTDEPTGILIRGPMLVHNLEPTTDLRYPVGVQPKIDGVRCMASRSEIGIRLRSRSNRSWAWLDPIRERVAIILDYLPPHSEIDGELYNPDITFETLQSIVRTTRTKNSRNDFLGYYMFDVVLEPYDRNGAIAAGYSYEHRHTVLDRAYRQAQQDARWSPLPIGPIYLLGYDLASSLEDIWSYHDRYVNQGFEGAIVRKLAGLNPTPATISESIYVPDRTTNLLKVKRFIDEEGTIVGVTESEGQEAGLALLVIEDKRGNQFSVRHRGSFGLRRYWLQNPNIVIGRSYTFRYFQLTEHGVPRFPIGIAIRDDL